MKRLVTTLSLMLLLKATLIVWPQQGYCAATERPGTSNVKEVCRGNILPEQILARISREYAGFELQKPSHLNHNALERWRSEGSSDCPGIAVGSYGGAGVDYAVLLVPKDRNSRGYVFTVFHTGPSLPDLSETMLEKPDNVNPDNLFIEKVRLSKFFDIQSRKRFKIEGNEGILLMDAGDQEYEADVYYQANGRFLHDPVDY